MRYSNYIFTKGSIVFVEFPPSSEQAYLNGRPLIVVSNPTHIIKTLIVCTTGTQNKPGIEVSFWNHMDKCYVGDVEVSKIYPYNMRTIYTDDIVASIGQLDPFIMKELDQAIDFHLGRSDEIPGYLKECEEYICGVSHHVIREKYITKETTSEKFGAQYTYRKEHRKPTKRSKNGKKSDKNHFSSKDNISQITNDEILEWTNASNNIDIDISKICNNSSELIHLIDEKSVNLIVSRIVPISLIAKKYSINQRSATFLRITLTNIAIRIGMNLMNGRIKRKSLSALADYVFIGMLLSKTFMADKNDTSTDEYNVDIDRVSQYYKINTNDRRIWRSVESFYDSN